MVDSLYYSSGKISERCENCFVDYRINYQKLCHLMRQITKDLNSAIVLLGKKRKLLCCPYVEFQKSCVGLSKFMSIFFFWKAPKSTKCGYFFHHSPPPPERKNSNLIKIGCFPDRFLFLFLFFVFFSFKFYFLLKSVAEGNTTIISRGAPFDFQGAWKLGSGKAAIFVFFFWFFLTPQMDEGFFLVSLGGEVYFFKNFYFSTGCRGQFEFFFSSLSSAAKIFVLFCFVFFYFSG